MALTKMIFCANEQSEQPHLLSIGPSGEIVATCQTCGRVIKFPAGISKEKFNELIAAHKEANMGQVTKESIDKTLAELADE